MQAVHAVGYIVSIIVCTLFICTHAHTHTEPARSPAVQCDLCWAATTKQIHPLLPGSVPLLLVLACSCVCHPGNYLQHPGVYTTTCVLGKKHNVYTTTCVLGKKHNVYTTTCVLGKKHNVYTTTCGLGKKHNVFLSQSTEYIMLFALSILIRVHKV